MARDVCPLCGAALDPGHGFAVDGQQYARCPGCHADVETPLPDPAAWAALDRDRYDEALGAAEASARRQRMLRRLLAMIPRRPPGRLLDVGCGGGYLLALARAAGWEVAGVDPSTKACALARSRWEIEVQAVPLEESVLPEASFDVVTLINVLDQAPHPVRLLGAARRALRPGGLLVARIPNGDFHRAAWAAIRRLPPPAAERLRPLVIFHPLCLNARALRALLGRADLVRLRLGNAPLSGPEGSVPVGAAGRTALASLAGLAQAGAHLAAWLTADRVLWAPSLLALAEREAA